MLSLLYVDDDLALLEICKIFLEADGSLQVQTASSVDEALTMMNHRKYDAIISDYEMPHINGIAFLKTLRSSGNMIPFLVFTGKGREEIVIEAFNSGADFYVQKGGAPKAQFAELIHKVRKAVGRSRTDRALEESNSVLRATLEATADGILVVDSEGKITTFNRKFLSMWNISEETAEEQDSNRLFGHIASQVENPPEFGEKIHCIQLHPNKESYDVLTLTRGKTFEQSSKPQITGGTVTGRVWSFRDITPQNQIAMELNAAYEQIRTSGEQIRQQYKDLAAGMESIWERERRLRSFAEVVPDGIGISVNGKLIEANDQLAALFGLSVPDILNREIPDFIQAESHHAVVEQISPFSDCISEILAKGKNGEMIPVELRGHPIIYRGHDAWASVWRDLTERKLAEKNLADSEVKYRSVFNAWNNPLFLIDHETMTIRDINDAGCQAYGYFRSEIVGKNVLDLCTEPETVLQDIKKKRLGIRRYHHRRKDGKVFPVEASITFFVHEGRPVFVFAVNDITEARLAEDALRHANFKLKLLIGITRHDVSNKLSALMGYNQIISDRIPDPEIRPLLESQKKAAVAIRTHMEFTRNYEELGGKAPQWQDVHEIVSRAEAHFLKTIPVTCNLNNIEIYADPMIEKVFYNLFDNAFRYGEKINAIKIFSTKTVEDLTIVFEDDGIGILDKEKENIFFQGIGRNTGLGLFLSREILSITNICIKESGEFQKGAKFEITVPVGFFRIKGKDEKNQVSGSATKALFSS